MLHRITGRAVKCGPAAISAIAGVTTHEAAAVIRRLFDRPAVNGVYIDELAAALEEFGCAPDYALRSRHPKYRERTAMRAGRMCGSASSRRSRSKTQARPLALAVRQAAGGRAPRLVRRRRPRRRRHPPRQGTPGGRHSPCRGNPVRHLCDAALARAPGQAVAPRPDRGLARGRRRRGRAPRLPRASSSSTRPTPWPTRRGPRASAAR